jgi:hypothetical protein
VTTIVVETGGFAPVVWIRQGPAPAEWLGDEAAIRNARSWIPAPRGLAMSIGGGLGSVAGLATNECGDVTDCQGESIKSNFSVGATYWLSDFLGADVTYFKPGTMSVTGSGTTSGGASFNFSNALELSMVSIGGRAGGQAGPVRVYGMGGATYASATSTTTQTVAALTTAPGGTEALAFRAKGWGWMAGGGFDMWVKPWIGFYVEGGFYVLKGSTSGQFEATLDQKFGHVTVGARIQVPHTTRKH